MKIFFNDTYDKSKEAFLNTIPQIKETFSDVRTEVYKVKSDDDALTIDLIKANPSFKRDKLLIITTGMHGVEGYVGGAMLQLFIEKYLPKLNAETTGIAFVHAINPWGMKNFRRVNENNIDLNRNFILHWEKHDKNINKNYQHINDTLNPSKPCSNGYKDTVGFIWHLLKSIVKLSVKEVEYASKLGQFKFPQGLFYGGDSYEESTHYIMRLYEEQIAQYKQIISIDLHTGYGPAYQMGIINSPYEKKSVLQMKQEFSYPLIQKATKEDFYQIEGDSLNYLYRLVENEFKNKDFYGVGFEFGTKGDSFIKALSSLKILIDENQLYHYGCNSEKREEKIKEQFLSLFYPKSSQWRDKACQDFRSAIEGILRAKDYMK